jgi:hypothetical protein
VRVTPSDRSISFKTLALASIAVVVGALTHIAWDAFTHTNTIVTDAFPVLTTRLFEYHGRGIRVFFLLQILSSIFGLFALWLWALNLRRREPQGHAAHAAPSSLTDRARILAVLAVVAVSGATALLAFGSDPGARFTHRFFDLLIGGMAGCFLAWCVVAVLITRTARADRR